MSTMISVVEKNIKIRMCVITFDKNLEKLFKPENDLRTLRMISKKQVSESSVA
jgi:hypothetical protein